jgi:AcrR family transcriptional regulator
MHRHINIPMVSFNTYGLFISHLSLIMRKMPKVVPEYKEEARNRIIQQATELFIEQGYKKTKMTEIAKKLGVSKGAIYQYFRSKEELLFEAMKNNQTFRRSSIFYELPTDKIDEMKTPEFFTRMVKSSEKLTKFGMEVASEALYNKKMLREITNFYLDEVNLVTQYFEKLKTEGIAHPDVDSVVIAIGILALRGGLRGFTSTDMDEQAIQKTWRFFMDLLLNEIKNPPKNGASIGS